MNTELRISVKSGSNSIEINIPLEQRNTLIIETDKGTKQSAGVALQMVEKIVHEIKKLET